MYLEPDECAHCGKKLDPSSRHTAHNVKLAHLFPPPLDTLRAYFCSQRCVEAAFADYYPPDYGKDTKDREKDIVRKYVSMYGGQVNPDLRPDNKLPYGSFFAWPHKKGKGSPDRLSHSVNSWVQDEIRALRNRQQEMDACAEQAAPAHFVRDYCAGRQRVALELHEKTRPRSFSECAASVKQRYEHIHILGPSGSGKTTLVQEMSLTDLLPDDPPALVVVDPKGVMVKSISRLKAFEPRNGRLRDRLVIIDLMHDPAPPLNIFRQAGTEAAVNYAINNFDYLFAQAGSELTPRMRPVFRFCARLAFSIPNADIDLLMDFLDPDCEPNDPRFKPYIDQLTDLGAKRFFLKDFHSDTYKATRIQIKERFNDINSMTRIRDAFTSKSPSLDMERCLRERKIVLVNTGFTEVGPRESELLGRHIINLTIGAAFARGVGGPPAFLYIDEFQDYVDDVATAQQLRLARNYNLGIICAHQNMFDDKLSDSLRSAISGNTAIKYCSQLKGKDRSYMLGDLGCDQEFLDAQVPDEQASTVRFACAIKGKPVTSIAIRYPNITPDMQMSANEYQEVRQSRCNTVSVPQTVRLAETEPPAPDPKIVAFPQNANKPKPSPDDDPDEGFSWNK